MTLYRRLIAIRRNRRALTEGHYAPVEQANPAVFAYRRELGEDNLLVTLNFSSQPQTVALAAQEGEGDIVVSTHLDREGEACGAGIALRADEGLLIALRKR